MYSCNSSELDYVSEEMLDMPEIQFDWDYLSDTNVEEIRRNIKNRKDVGSIDRVVSIWYYLYLLYLDKLNKCTICIHASDFVGFCIGQPLLDFL